MMAALLVAMGVMAVLLGVLMPVWSTAARREREAELIFRGEQYARAIGLFQRKYANASPPTIDVLVNERFLRRKYVDPITGGEFQVLTTGSAMTAGGPGAPGAAAPSGSGPRAGGPGSAAPAPTTPPGRGAATPPGRGGSTPSQPGALGAGGAQSAGIMGVTSKSTEPSLRLYNGKQRYNEWAFMPVQMTARAGGPNPGQTPGGLGAPGAPGAGGLGGGRGRGAGPAGPPRPGGGGSGFGSPSPGSSPSSGGFGPSRP